MRQPTLIEVAGAEGSVVGNRLRPGGVEIGGFFKVVRESSLGDLFYFPTVGPGGWG
jgi:hypothetical protein